MATAIISASVLFCGLLADHWDMDPASFEKLVLLAKDFKKWAVVFDVCLLAAILL